MLRALGDFKLDGMMRYSIFVPRLFNLCLSLGFEPGKIMPSRAFCSDESQGYPIILLTKHFGTFPFNHGMVGGVVDTGRHGPHAHHGRDIVILQASHVGYDPEQKHFGVYRRLQMDGHEMSPTCGKICGVNDWYLREYAFARNNIFLLQEGKEKLVVLDNQLLDAERPEGLFVNLEQLLEWHEGDRTEAVRVYSTARAYRANPQWLALLPESLWQEGKMVPIGEWLRPGLFEFRRTISNEVEGHHHLEHNLIGAMPAIVTAENPALEAAKFNTIIEFDRTYRSLVRDDAYNGKNLIFIAGLNIDISPSEEQIFPLTKFVPWAAYIQGTDGGSEVLEQAELLQRLREQSTDNPHQADLEQAIERMNQAEEVRINTV